MARPDASPEHDVISLQIISLAEAQHLFDSYGISLLDDVVHVCSPFAHPLYRFMELITNGSMYFDPRLHTLPFVRSRSSFLLAVILAIASTYKSICPSAHLHALLMSHAHRLETVVRNNHLKSIEIIQGLLLLASWTEIPSTLARDKTWMFVSHALALVVELRLDASLPYCVQTDPLYHKDNHDLLVRNAHRVCFLMYIHDRVSDWKNFFFNGCTEMVVEYGDGGGLASGISRFCFNVIRLISKMGETSCKVEFPCQNADVCLMVES